MCGGGGGSDQVHVQAYVAFSSLSSSLPDFPPQILLSQALEKCELAWDLILSLDMVKVWGVGKKKGGQKEEVIPPDPRPAVEVRND